MQITTTQNVYGITESGYKVKIGVVEATVEAKTVGGVIYHIDTGATGAEYTFYDSDGNKIENVAVGDSPYAYSVSGTPSKDKYFVADKNQYYLASNHYPIAPVDPDTETVAKDPLPTSYDVGSGKNNTSAIMSYRSGLYVSGTNASGENTIWKKISEINATAANGINDWFLPSANEMVLISEYVSNGSFWTSSNRIKNDGTYNETYMCIIKNKLIDASTKQNTYNCVVSRSF